MASSTKWSRALARTAPSTFSCAAVLDRDTLAIAPPFPTRDEAVVFEMTYAAQIAPWWIVQPDLQYIVHPGGNVPNPNDPTVAIGNAFIAGIRSTIKF